MRRSLPARKTTRGGDPFGPPPLADAIDRSAHRIEDRRIDGVPVTGFATRPHERFEGGRRQRDEQPRRGVPGVLDGVWHAAVEVARIANLEDDHVLTARKADATFHAE